MKKMAVGDTARLNWSFRRHPFHYIVERNGNDFEVYYRNLNHNNATGANNRNRVYIGTIVRESAYAGLHPWFNFVGTPVFVYTNRRDMRNHEALTEALAIVNNQKRAVARMQV